MKIQCSKEDYLEAIYDLEKSGSRMRSVDVAEQLGFTKPSVSRAVSLLQEDGLIVMDENKMISLTKEGKGVAVAIRERHNFFKQMLEYVGVDDETAAEDACKLEHAISDKSFKKLKTAFEKNHKFRLD